MRVASDPSFLRSLINHKVYPIDLLDDPPPNLKHRIGS